MKKGLILTLFMLLCFYGWASRPGHKEESRILEQEEKKVDPLELIEEHTGDSYFWPLVGIPVKPLTLPLPVIVRNPTDKRWDLFLSSHLADGQTYKGYFIATEGDYAGKVMLKRADGTVVRPMDLSFTRNAAALFVAGAILFFLMLSLSLFYKRYPLQMPRRFFGALEMLIEMLVNEVIRPCLGRYAREYTPYLLTLFFFILTINLLGLTVVFPGGVNLSGNVSVCLVLASCTLVLTLLAATRGYWREIFLPDVPIWLNTPIPLM
ncbi:MAG: F0F1 ATP synthase subunit A, partial [Bacteroidales bacterium]